MSVKVTDRNTGSDMNGRIQDSFQRTDKAHVHMLIRAQCDNLMVLGGLDWNSDSSIRESMSKLTEYLKAQTNSIVQFLTGFFSKPSSIFFKEVCVIVDVPYEFILKAGEERVITPPPIKDAFAYSDKDISEDKLLKSARCIRNFFQQNSKIDVLQKCLENEGFSKLKNN